MSQPSQDGDHQFERILPPKVLTELLKDVTPPPPRQNKALGLLWGLLALPSLIILLVPIITALHQIGGGTQLPQPPAPPPRMVQVRRALPTVPRATLVNAPSDRTMVQINASDRMLERIRDPYIIGQWYAVTYADGSQMQIRYGGQLASTALLPAAGEMIGDARVIDNHYWIWMQPTGAPASWVDP
jgi:hypothetical protein